MQLEGFHLDKAHATLVPTHVNIAAAHIKLGDNHAAVFSCSQVGGCSSIPIQSKPVSITQQSMCQLHSAVYQ